MSVSVVLIEGPCGAGKSTLIKNVTARARSSGIVVRVFTQGETYAPIAPSEDSNILDDALNFEILSRIVGSIERAYSSLESPALILVDTLHITQFVRPGLLSEDSFERIEELVATMLTATVFLRAKSETLRARTIEGRRGSGFIRYLQRYANGEQAMLEYLLQTQEAMIALLGRCRSTLHLLSAEAPPDELSKHVIDIAFNGRELPKC